MKYKCEWQSPLGTLRLFGDGESLTGLYFEQHSPAPKSVAGETNVHAFRSVIGQLEEFFAGERKSFEVPITLEGTDFQREVWTALQQIPYGETTCYRALAVACGRPSAVRAVGSAVSRNPISVVIPCHRVLGTKGALTGFAGGLKRKQKLLDLEQTPVESV